jgi:putative endonuclease
MENSRAGYHGCRNVPPADSGNIAAMRRQSDPWWLYVLECRSGMLYTGIAKDVDARFEAHAKGAGAIFTRLNPPVRIVGKASLASRAEALRAEYALKQVCRAEKLRWCAAGLQRFVDFRRSIFAKGNG